MFTAPSNPLRLAFPPPILHLRVGRAPSSCASNNRVETPCGSRQRLPHPSRNEQRAISLLLNACHKSPRAPSTPPLPSNILSTPSTPSPSSSIRLSPLNVLPSPSARTTPEAFLPSLLVTRVSFPSQPPRPCRPFLLSARLEGVSTWKEGEGRYTGTRNVHFCGSHSV